MTVLVKTWFLPVLCSLLSPNNALEFQLPYNTSVNLPCHHNKTNPGHLIWTYNDKTNNDMRTTVISTIGSGIFDYGPGFNSKKVAMNYSTGNLDIHNLGCHDNQTYTCTAAGTDITSHTITQLGMSAFILLFGFNISLNTKVRVWQL